MIATEYVWAKSLVKEQSDLTKRGMDQRGQGWHTTALFNSSLSGQSMHLRPPTEKWMGQNSVCHWCCIAISRELDMESQLALFRKWTRLSLWVGRVSTDPLCFYWPLPHWEASDHQSVQCFRGSNASVLQVWISDLYFTFHSDCTIIL